LRPRTDGNCGLGTVRGRIVAAVSSTGSSVFRNVNVNFGSEGDRVEDGVDTIGKSVRRGVKRVPCDGCDVMHEGSLRPGERLEGAVDDGRRVLRGAKNEATHGGFGMLDDMAAGMVGVGRVRWKRVERLPHCCSGRTNRGHQAGLAICHTVAHMGLSSPPLLDGQLPVSAVDAFCGSEWAE